MESATQSSFLYNNGLGITFLFLEVLGLGSQALTGLQEYNEFLTEHDQPAAVFAIIFLSIYLREIGSPQSKPVDAPHFETGE